MGNGITQEQARISDNDLIAAVRQGNSRAADMLVKRYYPKVVNICFTFFRSPEDVHDVAQEVFTKVFGERKICCFKGEAKFWTWLYRVTVNTCKTWAARNQRNRQMVCPEQVMKIEENIHACTDYKTPDHALQWEQTIEHLHSILKKLPMKYLEIIRLIYWEDKSYQEAAARLDMPVNIFGVNLMRGRNLLAKLGKPAFADHLLN